MGEVMNVTMLRRTFSTSWATSVTYVAPNTLASRTSRAKPSSFDRNEPDTFQSAACRGVFSRRLTTVLLFSTVPPALMSLEYSATPCNTLGTVPFFH